jgi:predicted metalloprotease with PDZ domain
MMLRAGSRLAGIVCGFALTAAWPAAAATTPITLSVDATEAPRKIFHAHLVIPAAPGPLRLYYPKWIPGEHGPTGPLVGLAGVKMAAAGKPLAWRRDPLEMYAFQVEVPAGASGLDVDLDYLAPASGGFTAGASATANLAVLSWNTLLLYPQGGVSNDLTFTARVRVPEGWKYATALPVASASSGSVEFQPVSLDTLVDSPVLMGAHMRSVTLGAGAPVAHSIEIAADSETALAMKPEDQAGYDRLVAEAGALFGARHYRSYRWLLTLSDAVAHFGLEHHESSDDRMGERTLSEDGPRRGLARLLAHEYAHSWNGKYRRPADLVTGDLHQPIKSDLLWVYEGLTQYLGNLLPPRSGLWTAEEFREAEAAAAASLDYRGGRTWRPLVDTATEAQVLYFAPEDWASWRRGVDFYDEGNLIWLEADVVIRQQTAGRRSLDDFMRRFHGGPTGAPALKTYVFDDVVAALNDVAPYDWRGFLEARVQNVTPHAPLGGIENGGWRLVYTDVPNIFVKDADAARIPKTADHAYSIGLIAKEDGFVGDVIPDSPAAKAGIGPGMKIVAVGGRRFTLDALRDAIKDGKGGTAALEMIVANGDFFGTYKLDYHGGERYPHLERDPARPDLLSEIVKPLVAPKPKARS